MSLSVLVASTIISMSSVGSALHDRPADLGHGAVSARYESQFRVAVAGGAAADPLAAVGAKTSQAIPRLSVQGGYTVTPDGAPIRLRGWNWGAKKSAQAQDAAANVAQGANFVRLPLSWYFGDGTGAIDCGKGLGQDSYDPSAPGLIAPASLAALDEQVQWASDAHLWVDVMVRGGDCDFWTNRKIIPQFVQMWEFLADHYKNTPYMGTYSLLSEPHPPSGSNDEVRDLYRKVIRGVRAIDGATPIIIGGQKDYEIRNLEQIYMPDQVNVIYTANFYELPGYVKQAKGSQAS